MTYEGITKLKEYQKLMDMGWKDVSTPLLQTRQNIKLTHTLLGERDTGYFDAIPKEAAYFIIFQNGYTRTYMNASPAPVPSLKTGPLTNESDWNLKMSNFRKFITKKIVKDTFGVSKREIQNQIGDTDSWEESAIQIITILPSTFFNWVLDQPKTTQALFLGLDGNSEGILVLAKQIAKDPGKWAEILKREHKSEFIKKAVSLLPPEMSKRFQKDLDMLGDLSDLGI